MAIPNGVFGDTPENMREHIEPLMFNEYVCVVCKVLDYSGIPLEEHHIGDITEFPTIKAIVKIDPYPDSWEVAFVLQFLVNLPCPNDPRFEFMVEGVVKFAVLVKAPILRPQETFEPIIRREATKGIDGDFHERWWDRVFAFVLKTYKDPENLKRFLELSMCRLQSRRLMMTNIPCQDVSRVGWTGLSYSKCCE
jgi:hypothetical protein